jgi:hypothetical protein
MRDEQRRYQLSQVKKLPCIREMPDGAYSVTLVSKKYVSKWIMEMAPIDTMREITLRQRAEAIAAFDEKLRVLDEIESGRLRFEVDGGQFRNVGEERR